MSTGPRTDEWKATSRRSALKDSLTAETVVNDAPEVREACTLALAEAARPQIEWHR